MNTLKWNTAYLLIGLTLFLVSCGKSGGDAAEAIDISENAHVDQITVTRGQFAAANMQLGALEQQSFARVIKANGYIDVPPERKASVSVKLGGFVKSLTILPGQKVARGSVLFTLDNPEFIQLQQDYLETHAMLKYLQSDYERQKTLASENIASQKNFLKAESDYLVARAKHQGLLEKLRMININIERLETGVIESVIHVYSPISGYISSVNISRGIYVAPADIAVEIIDTQHMHVELMVFEKDIAAIRKGQGISFQVTGSSVQHQGEVYLIGSTIESDTRTVNIHGHIADEDEITDLMPGMYVEATIQVASVQRPVLPAEAVVSLDNVNYVLVLLDETPEAFRFRRMEVSTGQANNQWTEITSAASFPPDAKFLVKGAFNLVVE